MAKKKKAPYDHEVEATVVEEAIADDEFVGYALERLFEWMERSDSLSVVHYLS